VNENAESENSPASSRSNDSSESSLHFTFKQKILLWLISTLGGLLVRAIGCTLRYAISFEDGAPPTIEYQPMVVSFWHNSVLPSIYISRNLSLRVMTSHSFDGEWIARIIRKFGFESVRGSASRGSIRGLMGMKRELEEGWTVVFPIDGPRGPRYVAKPGPVMLAGATGLPMVTFYVAVERAWILKTWDRCVIPKPFSKALLRMGKIIHVPKDADRDEYLAQLQGSLDRVRIFAEENVAKVGTAEFPIAKR
jgi:hypothetical protein